MDHIYYAHPYASWERGTNENHNRLIRRWLPKGTKKTTPKEVAFIENWINNYPKKCLDYKSPREDCLLANLNLKFSLPYPNAKLEATNNLIKLIKRNAFGFRNFENFKKHIFIALNIKKERTKFVLSRA